MYEFFGCDYCIFLHYKRIMSYIGYVYPVFKKGKAVPLHAWRGPEGSRKLRFPDFVTTAQDSGKVVSLMHRPLLPLEIFLVLISVGG